MRIRITSLAGSLGLLALFLMFAPASWAALTVTTACPAPVATQGQPYSLTISVSGAASGPLTFSLNGTNLPPGLSLNSPGTISGVPTATGSFPISIQVVDSSSQVAYYNCNIVVQQQLTVTAACPAPIAVLNVPYSFTVAIAGGVGPYNFFLESEGLPNVTINTSTGVLSGTPQQTGTFSYTVVVNDSQDNTAVYSCNLVVNEFQITASCPALNGNVGTPYSFPISVSTAEQVTWALGNNPLPPGLTLNAATGVISGTPTTTGTYPFSVVVSNVSPYVVTQTYTCSITISAPTITGTTVCPITAIPATLSATGGSAALTYSIVGSLPPNLTLTGNVISGQLIASPGSYGFTIQITDGYQVVQQPCSVVVAVPTLQITSGCPASTAPLGTPVSFTLTAAGGVGGYAWSIYPGLPQGLTLTGNVISGTPTGSTGTVSFTIQVISGSGSTTIPCSITISQPKLVLTSSCPANGMVGVAIVPIVLTATGGLGSDSYKYSVQGTLPPGVTLSGNTISGTPTAAGNYVFSYTVISGTQTAISAGCSVTISVATLQLTSNCPSAPVTAGSLVSISFVVSGGVAPYTYALTGPAFLTMSTSGATTTVSGTPSASQTGPFAISLMVIDSAKNTASSPCNLTVNPMPLLITGSCPVNPVSTGSPISVPVTGTGGLPPYTWAVSGNSGLTLAAVQGLTDTLSGNAPAAVGSYNFALTLSDSAKTQPATLSCTLNVQLPPLQISGTCPASTLNLPLTLSVPLTAAGGQAPYAWTISGPSFIVLSSTSGATNSVSNSGSPGTAGAFSFAVSLADSAGSKAAAFSCSSSINTPPTPGISVTGLTLQPSLLQTTSAGIQLSTPALLPIVGTAQLTFIPNAFGITDNPQVYFNGGSRTATFTITPGQTSFNLPSVQQGTDAGTIHIEITDLQQGGVEVLAAPHPASDLTIPRMAPVVASTDVSFANETTTGFDVVINGYSTPRDMKSVTLTFSAANGASLNGTTSFTVDLSTLFSTFYTTAASQLAGSQWQNLHVPVTTTGDKTAIGSVTVTIANSAGNSQAITLSR